MVVRSKLACRSKAFSLFCEKSTNVDAEGRWEVHITHHPAKDKEQALGWADLLRASRWLNYGALSGSPLPSNSSARRTSPNRIITGKGRRLFNFTSALQKNPNARYE